jgi:short-subunit dehydrogenase
MRQKNDFTLITGATSGIGKELALLEAAKGNSLILTGRREQELQKLSIYIEQKYEVQTQYTAVDLSVTGSSEQLFRIASGFGNVTTLINNAGFGAKNQFEKMNITTISDMIQVNITSLTELTQLFGSEMIRKGNGEILTIASVAAFIPTPYLSVYGATKAYVLSFTKALRAEWKDKGIAVSCCCPGTTRTEFFERAEMIVSPILPMQSATDVAKTALNGLRRNAMLTIPGVHNKIMRIAVALLPDSLLLPIAKQFFLTR